MRYTLFFLLFISFFTLSGQSKRLDIKSGHIGDFKGNVYDLCFTPSGKVILIPEENRICFYDLDSKKLIKQWTNGHTKPVLTLDISPDGNFFASGGLDSTVLVRKAETGEISQKLKIGGVVTSLHFSSDNLLLACGSSDKKVRIYDTSKGNLKYCFDDFSRDITTVKFSPDDQLIAVSSLEKKIRLYELTRGSFITELIGHKNSVRDLCFNEAGTRIFSCGDDGRMIIWDITNLKQIKIKESNSYKTDWLLCVDARPDAVVVAGVDSKIRVKTNMVSWEGKIGVPVNKILFIPKIESFLKFVIATRGKGVFLIDAVQFTQK